MIPPHCYHRIVVIDPKDLPLGHAVQGEQRPPRRSMKGGGKSRYGLYPQPRWHPADAVS